MSAGSSRLSVASQFFMDDDDGGEGQTVSDRVVDLLQQTHTLPRDSQKINNLTQVQQLIIDKDPSLLDNFLDEVLQFQFDDSIEVRKFVLSFAECACKKDNQILCTVLPRLHMMLTEENQPAAVIKRVILCTSQLFRVTIKWIAGVKDIREEIEAGWASLMLMKKKIVSELLDDDNDGVRTYAIKFSEMIATTLSAKSSDSLVPKRAESDITLDQFPDGNSLLIKKKLQHEGTHSLDALLSLLVSASISSINLMVCMGSLTSIAKQRPDSMPKVIQAFENLHVNLPPTLSKSQVSSVRKSLKIQLFGLLRHRSSVDLRRNIGTLLTDLGASEVEIIRNTPRVSERPKRSRNEAEGDQSTRKKQKVLDDEEEGAEGKKKDEPGPSKRVTKATVIDLLAAEVEPLLRNHENVANLVLLSMVSLPDTMLENHILEDLRSRNDIALAWLYQEYSNIQGYMPHTHGQDVTTQRYDSLLCNLLKSLLVRTDQRDGLFNRLVMEAPVITDDALKVIRQFCEDETHFYAGMHALRELILKKPADLEKYVKELLDLTQHERTEVRSQAIQYIKRFYDRADLKPLIEEFATSFLRKLLLSRPPAALVLCLADQEMQAVAAKAWTEETTKMCLYLYLALLPVNHKLIHELANVYVAATADIKRTVLRVLETPVRGVGMSSPELLLLVETCPKGAETLVTRMMHILTDKTPPSIELVKRVKDLYHKRVSDVRFLIPVLTGLEKKDVISAMPKLIRLNPIVVKEVFHRLLMSHQAESSGGQSPLTPAELLVALHNIDPSKCDMKSIIKATSLCFSEKSIYTGEVLAVVMQQLMEQTPLPTLLLRTIIQSLSMYPKLKGFIMNLLLRLINKQVWKTPKLWEGFVKCCERTIPQSFQVLLQLPPPQLAQVFDMSKDMRVKLLAHVQNFSSHQVNLRISWVLGCIQECQFMFGTNVGKSFRLTLQTQTHVPKAIMKSSETDPEREGGTGEERQKRRQKEKGGREEERLRQKG
nr:symplekin-like [Lytechinus pictus]